MGMALEYLDKSLSLGFNDYKTLNKDLKGLKNDPQFQKVLEKHKVPI